MRVRVWWCGIRLLQDDDKVLTWIHHVFNRWAGSYGIEADYVAMSNCTIFGIKTEVVLVSTFKMIQSYMGRTSFKKIFSDLTCNIMIIGYTANSAQHKLLAYVVFVHFDCVL
jgi:hypothetical protein